MTQPSIENSTGPNGTPEQPLPKWLPLNGLTEQALARIAALGITVTHDADPGFVSARFPHGYHVLRNGNNFPIPTPIADSDGTVQIIAHWGDGTDGLTIVNT